MDDHILNKYFNHVVRLEQQKKDDYEEVILENVKKILDTVHTEDSRFCPDPVRAGDYWQTLEVSRDNVHDLYYVLLQDVDMSDWTDDGHDRFYAFNYLESREKSTLAQNLQVVNHDDDDIPLPPPPEGHRFMTAEGCGWENNTDFVRQGDIIPYLVRRRLRKLIKKANEDLYHPGDVLDCDTFNCPTISLIITNDNNEDIRVDFEPMIQAKLPFPRDLGWPRDNIWPDRDLVEKVRRHGIDVVAQKEFYWTLSFTEAERQLVAKVDADGGKRKQIYRTLVKIHDQFWTDESNPVITPYMLKNVWFWEIQKYPYTWQWIGPLWTRLGSICRALCDHIRTRHLKKYFQPKINLLQRRNPEHLDGVAQRIQSFLDDPRRALDDETAHIVSPMDMNIRPYSDVPQKTIYDRYNEYPRYTYTEPERRCCDCCIL